MKTIQLTHTTSLAAIRIMLGITYIIHGVLKLIAGKGQWQFLGEQLQLLGIDAFPVFFGLLATFSELVGGLLLVTGYFTRMASLALMGTMAVALLFMIKDTGSYSQFAYPLTNLLILAVFLLSPSKKIRA